MALVGQASSRSLAFIERELPKGAIAVSDLAHLCGLSAVHLRTVFRRATGMAPHQYVQSRRIALACQLLGQQLMPVADVAQAVGIAETRVFHRLFKRLTGTTPQVWRRDGFQ